MLDKLIKSKIMSIFVAILVLLNWVNGRREEKRLQGLQGMQTTILGRL